MIFGWRRLLARIIPAGRETRPTIRHPATASSGASARFISTAGAVKDGCPNHGVGFDPPAPSTDGGSLQKLLAVCVAGVVTLAFAGVALAQSGHFVGEPTCTDIGTQVRCAGKVAGLGGTTFQIDVEAQGVASVECRNPAGNVAPGQSFTTTSTGSSGPQPTPRNGSARFTVTTVAPTAPAGSCPNNKWTATVTDVEFTTATVTLREGGAISDQETVPVQ